MTQNKIIEAARKMGLKVGPSMYGPEDVWGTGEDLYRFADFIARIEREACAKIADSYADGLERNYSEIIADKIRARGQE